MMNDAAIKINIETPMRLAMYAAMNRNSRNVPGQGTF
jgi:hypothetical protein